MTTIKTIGLVVLGVIVGVLFSVSMNGGGNLAGVYEQVATYFPQGISTDATAPTAGQVRGTTLTVTGATTLGSSSATTSINVGKVCYTITSATGTVFYASYNGAGALATSTTSCN